MKVIHFNNGSGGGVLSVIQNLIEYSQSPYLENHVIYTIEKESSATMIDFPKAASVQIFKYDRNWNFYHTCKQLRKLIPDERAVLIAHDWLELGMISHLGLQNPVIQFLHGDFSYYYELAKKHRYAIDYHVCVSPVIKQNLSRQLPYKKNKIDFYRFPVPNSQFSHKEKNLRLKLIYCVRDLNEERKQFKVLPEIQKELVRREVKVEWTIIGQGRTEIEIKELFGPAAIYYASMPNEGVLKEMSKHDLFLLPSLKEGFPVVVVEAMKTGLVPLTSHWNGAVADLIIEGETGFQFEVNDAKSYADRIERLDKNREEFMILSNNSSRISNTLFDPLLNTRKIEICIEDAKKKVMCKKPVRVYGTRLDRKWIPNQIVYLLRLGHKSLERTVI